MHKGTSKTNLYWFLSSLLMGIVLLFPNVTYAFVNDAGFSYIITSIIFLLPIVICLSLLSKKWAYCFLAGILTIFSMVDQTMVDLYKEYLLPGSAISLIKTNSQEAFEFYNTNFREIFHLIPILILGILSCILYKKPHFNTYKWIATITLLLIPISFVTYKIQKDYKNEITLRYYVHNRILNRTPFNVFYQSWNTYIDLKHRRQADNMKNINMGAHRTISTSKKEIYIFAIGESLRYDNVSLNGKYWRTTTPKLECLQNIMLFDNYYSQACLTMYSVPQLVTRATPNNFELNFVERSVIEPFRECGFKVFTIVSATNLLSYETYLSNGVDSLIIVPNVVKDKNIISGDKTMIHIVDSLAGIYDKLFIMMQFYGNHSFFTNYEQEFEKYNPNSNNCPTDQIRDSMMLINAYDNSILYTDYILSSLIDAINRPNTISGMMFVSDHGEDISHGGAGHGGNCKPVKCEYHVPFIFWWSTDYAMLFPQKINNAQMNRNAKINGDCMYYNVIDMADITLSQQYQEPTWSVLSDNFSEHKRLILVPDGKTCVEVE